MCWVNLVKIHPTACTSLGDTGTDDHATIMQQGTDSKHAMCWVSVVKIHPPTCTSPSPPSRCPKYDHFPPFSWYAG